MDSKQSWPPSNHHHHSCPWTRSRLPVPAATLWPDILRQHRHNLWLQQQLAAPCPQACSLPNRQPFKWRWWKLHRVWSPDHAPTPGSNWGLSPLQHHPGSERAHREKLQPPTAVYPQQLSNWEDWEPPMWPWVRPPKDGPRWRGLP